MRWALHYVWSFEHRSWDIIIIITIWATSYRNSLENPLRHLWKNHFVQRQTREHNEMMRFIVFRLDRIAQCIWWSKHRHMHTITTFHVNTFWFRITEIISIYLVDCSILGLTRDWNEYVRRQLCVRHNSQRYNQRISVNAHTIDKCEYRIAVMANAQCLMPNDRAYNLQLCGWFDCWMGLIDRHRFTFVYCACVWAFGYVVNTDNNNNKSNCYYHAQFIICQVHADSIRMRKGNEVETMAIDRLKCRFEVEIGATSLSFFLASQITKPPLLWRGKLELSNDEQLICLAIRPNGLLVSAMCAFRFRYGCGESERITRIMCPHWQCASAELLLLFRCVLRNMNVE